MMKKPRKFSTLRRPKPSHTFGISEVMRTNRHISASNWRKWKSKKMC